MYIHIPFCPYKCPYCDFVTHVGSLRLVEPYVDSVCREIEMLAETPMLSVPLRTVYLGGGTPGMLEPNQVARILGTVDAVLGVEAGAEITVETNPDTVDPQQLAGLRSAGVNRLSIGAQSLVADELRELGRGHGPEEVGTAVQTARRARFENVSLDLIYGAPHQSLESWRVTLDRALSLEPDHVSAYSLIVEPKTTYSRRQERGQLPLPADDDVADMYHFACNRLTASGFEHYEVANWARPGFEARHNLTYWRNQEFFAVGVGAYDYLRPYRSVRIRSVSRYIEKIQSNAGVIASRDEVTPELERFETAVMGLRLLKDGLNRRRFEERFREDVDGVYGQVIRELEGQGFLMDDGQRIRLREEMVPLANEAWERFLPASD